MKPVQLLPLLLSIVSSLSYADQPVRLVESPSLSPDGSTLLFSYRGDIWSVASQGGQAHRLTTHPADDTQPKFSPDGKQIAFVSDRTGSRQIFLMSSTGSEAKQVTQNTEGHSLMDWFPDGRYLLVLASRDHDWKYAQRLLKIDTQQQNPEQLLFNDSAADAKCSPDGRQLLFTTAGERWWRKGYHGSRAAQIWLYDINDNEFKPQLKQETDSLSPVWKRDGSGFYYSSSQGAATGARNLWEYSIEKKQATQLTSFEDDLVHQTTIAGDGKSLVFSHLFDLYRLELDGKSKPTKLEITVAKEDVDSDLFRRKLSDATDASITDAGLEVAFTSGGDVWVMETVLREPVRVTSTAEFETDPIFIDEGKALLCVGWKDGQADIVKITRADESKYWWQNSEFRYQWLTNESSVEQDLKLTPDGKKLAYVRQPGDLWLYDFASGSNERFLKGFDISGFDFSPDSKWITYATADNDFNSDIWIAKLDKSQPPVNITRHPYNEVNPNWSTDGTMIAFTGKRNDLEEIDIYYVYLTETEADTGSRDRKLKKTLEAFKKAREAAKKGDSKPEKSDKPEATKEKDKDGSTSESKSDADKSDGDKPKSDKSKADDKKKEPVEVKIDFENIHRRIRPLSISNSTESLLGWQPGGKKLIFSASVDGQRGTYSVEFPEELKPKKISSESGSIKGWLKSPDRMFWLSKGVPATQPISGGSGEEYSFSALQPISLSARNAAAFEAAWRTMRDRWYDDRLGNKNWDAIRRKYIDAATQPDTDTLATVIHLMLGELNGSHLGFTPSVRLGRKSDLGEDWRPVTGHLGARFDPKFRGPGWKIKDVIEGTPAADEDSRLREGEIILSIDGKPVDPNIDPASVLTGPLDRDIKLTVKAKEADGAQRDVTIRPTTYARVRSLLYQKWQDDNRRMVKEKAKEDNIGYLHIEGMSWASFMDFQRELFEVGFGKDGLIIDVRDNGGGSTADHLLTALTQPRHAITVPRGGGPGYPNDRLVYASWHKPIVVLCNQNSYSNAEIFSHAIKTLGRGKVIGVPTAGGVVSTGATAIMDVGSLRLPFRGWFLRDSGEDMELNGAVPDIVVWPEPTEIASGKDRQLNRAIKALEQSIKKWKADGEPALIKATERK
ncbi:MAG: S41 family peptidase [Pirellulales bacterium]